MLPTKSFESCQLNTGLGEGVYGLSLGGLSKEESTPQVKGRRTRSGTGAQPLTRQDCKAAGMKWNDQNVCADRTARITVSQAARATEAS
jgi:hypothetical protein